MYKERNCTSKRPPKSSLDARTCVLIVPLLFKRLLEVSWCRSKKTGHSHVSKLLLHVHRIESRWRGCEFVGFGDYVFFFGLGC